MSQPPQPLPSPNSDDSIELEIFEAALECPDSAAVQRLLEQRCGGDGRMRARILSMLDTSSRSRLANFSRGLVPVRPRDDEATVASNTMQEGGGKEGHGAELPLDRIERYRLLHRIGEGGCGTVYLAMQEQPVRIQVALKLIKPGMDTRQVLARFELERQTLAILDHPNIARILDAGTTTAGRPYFVMEYVRGDRITQYAELRRLTVQQRLSLFIPVCQAVQHAHQKGVIHRDIKPSNILVAEHEDRPVPKVIDFGIAKATSGYGDGVTINTEMNQVLGTPAYMSPEQAGSTGMEGVDTRSDIYSLGVVLYELLTGRTPFDARKIGSEGFDAVRRAIVETEPQRPSARLASLPPEELSSVATKHSAAAAELVSTVRGDLDWIVMKCLEKDRSRRYATANGLALDIERYLANEIIQARPPSAIYRFQKAFKRHRAWMLAGISTALVTVAALIVCFTMLLRESNARAIAEQQRMAVERLLARSEVAAGWEQWMKGRHDAAMASFVEALRLDASDPAMAAVDRMRIAAVRKTEPRLRTAWGLGKPASAAVLARHSDRVALAESEPDGSAAVRVYETDSGRPVSAPIRRVRAVDGLAFSPDERRLVVVDGKGVAQVFDAATGGVLSPEMDLGRPASIIRWAPNGKELYLAAPSGHGAPNGVIGIWNSITGERGALEELPAWNVQSMAISPDNRTFALGALTFAAFLGSLDDDPTHGIPDCWRAYDLVYSADGTKLLVAGAFGSAAAQSGARILDVATRKYLGNLLYHQQDARTAAFSPDGRLVATSSFDRTVRIWDARSGLPVSEPLAQEGVVQRLEFSPDNLRLLAVGADRCLRVWHVGSRSAWSQVLPQGGEILDARFTDEGRSVVAVSRDGQVAVWGTRHAFPPTRSLHSQESIVGLRLGTPDVIHVARRDGVATWQRDLDRQIGHIPFHMGGGRYLLETTADGFMAATVEEIVCLGGAPGRTVSRVHVGSRPAWWNVSLHSDRRRFVRVPLNSTNVSVCDVRLKEPIATFSTTFPMHSAAIRPGTSDLFAFGRNREVIIWDINTRRVVISGSRRGTDEPVTEAIFSADGRRLLLRYGETAAMELYDPDCLATGCEPGRLSPSASGAILSRDGEWIATGNWDRSVSIYHGAVVQQLPTEVDHHGIGGRLAFSDDNRFLVTSGTDWSRLWLTATGEALTPPMVTDGIATSMQFDSVARTVWVGTLGGELSAWAIEPESASLSALQTEFPPEIRRGTWDGRRAWTRYLGRFKSETAPAK